jgi:NAD(P)H-hydrate epimerase
MFSKVITPQEMRRVEALSFDQGVSAEDLMENVGVEIAAYVDALLSENQMGKEVLLLCGKGNNGGDAYVAGLYLIDKGYDVTAVSLHADSELSPLCLASKKRFIAADGSVIHASSLYVALNRCCVILDGLFGTGFKGSVEGIEKDVIELVNRTSCPTLAIDIPSGLNGETGAVESVAINAQITLSLCNPKTGFFLNDGWNYVGRIETLPIGLPENYLEMIKAHFYLLEEDYLSAHLPTVQRNRHKYQRGTVTVLAGTKEMSGAAYFCSLGAFRGGSGMVHLFVTEDLMDAYHNLPELILIPYGNLSPKEMADRINQSKAFVVGPGLGKGAVPFLEKLLPLIEVPTVADADALNDSISYPKQTILTPHHGEMARLLNLTKPDFDQNFIAQVQEYSHKKGVSILLKGAPTLYIHGRKEPIVIPFGDPGMATAGCGDLLSGIIGAALSQGLKINIAALFGAGIHGLAGERAAEKFTSYCLKTGDIAQSLPMVFQSL